MPVPSRQQQQTKGYLTAATDLDVEYTGPTYHFDSNIYANRVFDSHGVADPNEEIHFGPNIKDWPKMSALPENMILKVVSEIHDPVTTTDELIPSGDLLLPFQSSGTGRVYPLQKGSGLCRPCQRGADGAESHRGRQLSC